MDALRDAEPGDTVDVGEGTFETQGGFDVPSGVDLRGSGRGQTRLVGHDGENVVTILPGDGASQISGMTIETGIEGGESEFGIYAADAGRVTLDRVDVDVAYGIGVGVQGLDSLTLHDVTVSGGVTESNAGSWVAPITAIDAPAHGIVVLSTASVTIDAITVSGMASTGIQLVESNTIWVDGSLHTNMGSSILLSGGVATLESVSVSGMLQGFQLVPPFGLAAANGVALETTDVSIYGGGVDGESIGMLQDSARSTHHSLSITDNRGQGLVVQHSTGTLEAPALLLAAGNNDLSRNRKTGLSVLESSGIVVEDAVIEETAEVLTIIGDLTEAVIGDGIQVRRCGDETCPAELADIRFERVALHANARAGMVIEALDGPASGVFCGTIDVDADGIGAVVQNNTDAPGGWASIANTGSADFLETVRGVEPDFNQGGASLDEIGGR